MFPVSLSAYQTWQRCEASYYYRYVRRLRPLVKDIAPQRGTMVHSYLASFYQSMKDGLPSDDAHNAGLDALDKYREEVVSVAATAMTAGREELAQGYLDMFDDCIDLAKRYYALHGQHDGDRFEVVLVEHPIRVELVAGIRSTSIVDLVLRDRDNGRLLLVEHKTAATIPQSNYRLRDFQTLLYTLMLKQQLGMSIDEVLWNYLRTKRPTVPEPLKTGGMSRNKAIDTTWEVYADALVRHHMIPERYEDMHELLKDREATVFMPRFRQPILVEPTLLMQDYMLTSLRMRRGVWEWEKGRSQPVRSFSRDCSFCPFLKVCQAAITGGDEEVIIERSFRISNSQILTIDESEAT